MGMPRVLGPHEGNAGMLGSGGPANIDPKELVTLREKYGLEMDLGSIPTLVEDSGCASK